MQAQAADKLIVQSTGQKVPKVRVMQQQPMPRQWGVETWLGWPGFNPSVPTSRARCHSPCPANVRQRSHGGECTSGWLWRWFMVALLTEHSCCLHRPVCESASVPLVLTERVLTGSASLSRGAEEAETTAIYCPSPRSCKAMSYEAGYSSLNFCYHKVLTGCCLVTTPNCCACTDTREHVPAYPLYIDGEGERLLTTRWQFYCWKCRSSLSLSFTRSNSPHICPL